MTNNSRQEDIQVRIENTIAILEAAGQNVDGRARHDLVLAIDTLRTAQTALTALEAELDLVTAPDLSAAEEAQRLRGQLAASELRVADLEQRLVGANEQIQLEDQIHASEHDRLEELERRAKKVERLLETDADAFSTFMDNALDQDDRLPGRG